MSRDYRKKQKTTVTSEKLQCRYRNPTWGQSSARALGCRRVPKENFKRTQHTHAVATSLHQIHCSSRDTGGTLEDQLTGDKNATSIKIVEQ